MFAGASTPVGFVDLFDNIMPIKNAKRRLFLKGASGSGKSTFMKKVAAELEALGVPAEKFHCANDADSLDAVAFSSIGLSIMDATSPHAHDPEIPVAIDRAINFAEFIDEQKLIPHLCELKSLLIAKKFLLQKATHYLAAVGNIYNAENNAYESALNKHAITALAQKWINILSVENPANCPGNERKLFLSAITPDGFVSFADSYFKDSVVYGVSCDITVGVGVFLAELERLAIACGQNVTSFYSPFSPKQIEYLYFPQIDVAFVRTSGRYGYDGKLDEKIEISDYIHREMLSGSKLQDLDCDLFNKLLDETINSMHAARALHTRTEEIYISAIDFVNLNKATDKIIAELLAL